MNVLIAISDRLFGTAILEFLKKREWPHETKFRVMHVLEPLHSASKSGEPVIHPGDDYHKKKVKVLEDITAEIGKNLPQVQVEKVVANGKTHTAILQMAKDWPADLIVLGSHGRHGLDRYLLGSVSLAVTSYAPCSIAVVKIANPEQLDLNLCDDDMPQQVCTFDFERAMR
jgi:nucleotide-binding universal stress UspA family protein